MSQDTHQANVQTVVNLVRDRVVNGRRTVIAIAGPPASGKSTLAESVVECLNRTGHEGLRASLLPMDGFHFDNDHLRDLGLLARKGAVETFDAVGFSAAITALAGNQSGLLLPRFDRDRDRVVPDEIAIDLKTRIIVTEGNYLLLNREPWSSLRPLYDATVFVKAPLSILEMRLIERWSEQNLTAQAAQSKIRDNDLPNAALVMRESAAADLTIEHSVHDALGASA